MNLLQFFKRTVFPSTLPYTHILFREMILVVDPNTEAILNLPSDSILTITGFCGSLWVTSSASDRDYVVKNGESVRLAGGKIVIQAMTDRVPCRLHVKLDAPLSQSH